MKTFWARVKGTSVVVRQVARRERKEQADSKKCVLRSRSSNQLVNSIAEWGPVRGRNPEMRPIIRERFYWRVQMRSYPSKCGLA
jgi:hypothetical protein